MKTAARNLDPSSRRSLTPRLGLTIGAASLLFAVGCGANEQPSDAACHKAVIGEYGTNGVEQAIIATLQRDVLHQNDTEGYYGTHDASKTISGSLMQQHHNYIYAMPGDTFSFCVFPSKHIIADPRPGHQPTANDAP